MKYMLGNLEKMFKETENISEKFWKIISGKFDWYFQNILVNFWKILSETFLALYENFGEILKKIWCKIKKKFVIEETMIILVTFSEDLGEILREIW